MCPLRASAALHRVVSQPAARVGARQGTTRTIAGQHIVRKLQVLFAFHSAIHCLPPVPDFNPQTVTGFGVAGQSSTHTLLQVGATVAGFLDASCVVLISRDVSVALGKYASRVVQHGAFFICKYFIVSVDAGGGYVDWTGAHTPGQSESLS